ncbi:HAMP domain-containing histidine kinase [Neotamlana nanhaiensis]|uniref:HAMP domain-containing histidine kinase n=1 Tax=Neotamlana nanhaiensis TaxID=1382798 RepID=UPI0010408ED7|nr:HAMP domain-containing histidine kinase [Tamlana nanhaiensis]
MQLIGIGLKIELTGIYSFSSVATIFMFCLAYLSAFFINISAIKNYFITTTSLLYLISSFAIFFYLLNKNSVSSFFGFESLSWNTSILFFINSIALFEVVLMENVQQYNFKITPYKKTHPYQYFPYFFLLPILVIMAISTIIYYNVISKTLGVYIIFLFLNVLILFSIFLYTFRFIDFFKVISQKSKELYNANKTLNKVNNEIQEKNLYLEDFATITSHNLREPIIALKELQNYYKESFKNGKLNLREVEQMYQSNVTNLNYGLNLLINYHDFIKNLNNKTLDNISFSKSLKKTLKSLEYLKPTNTTLNFKLNADIKLPEAHINNIFNNLLTSSYMYNVEENELKIDITTYLTRKYFNIIYRDNSTKLNQQTTNLIIDNTSEKLKNYNNDRSNNSYGLYFLKLYIKKLNGKIDLFNNSNKGNLIRIKLNHE